MKLTFLCSETRANGTLQSGFFITSIIFYSLNQLFPVAGMGEHDEVDTYGTLTPEEAAKLGIAPNNQMPIAWGEDSTGSATQIDEKVVPKE